MAAAAVMVDPTAARTRAVASGFDLRNMTISCGWHRCASRAGETVGMGCDCSHPPHRSLRGPRRFVDLVVAPSVYSLFTAGLRARRPTRSDQRLLVPHRASPGAPRQSSNQYSRADAPSTDGSIHHPDQCTVDEIARKCEQY